MDRRGRKPSDFTFDPVLFAGIVGITAEALMRHINLIAVASVTVAVKKFAVRWFYSGAIHTLKPAPDAAFNNAWFGALRRRWSKR